MKKALTGVEYLLICIQANPGKSQDYYLRRLAIYTLGIQKYKLLGSPRNRGVGYFNNSSRYKNVLWTDYAPKTVICQEWGGGLKRHPRKSEMHLTTLGWDRANKAREKIGLSPCNEA
jgi:hypothetical protein